MSVKAKDQTAGDLCKSHAARCDKDFFRVCPSKLSKRELEDLYYSLLENNLELKRAVNSQNEKIRTLSTKVQRMTAHTRTSLTRDPKECCAGAKAAISEQKASIADLKKANECMAERIRRLNMRLCTAKQFLKRSPNQCANKCFNCISGASTVKNLSTSALHDKTDDIDNLRTVALSAQSVAKKSSTRTVETNTPEMDNFEKADTEKVCDENKCRTTMDEFKQKIVDLQEELSKTHTEYSARMSQLEEQVSVLRAAARASSLRTSDDARLLARRLEEASAAAELETQLKLERGKVAELEMQLKAADMSQEVAKTIEQHLSNVSQLEEKQRTSRVDSERVNICLSPHYTSMEVPPHTLPTTSKRLSEQLTVPEDKLCKSEDSGYAENNRESINSVNRELMQRVAHLQAQLDALKLTMDNPDQSTTSDCKLVDFDSYDVVISEPDVPIVKNIKDYNCVIIDPSKKVIVEIEHVNHDSADKGAFYPGVNSPNEAAEQVQNGRQPRQQTTKQHRDSFLSRQQSRFQSQTVQKRSSEDREKLVQSANQKADNLPELDKVLRRSSDESKVITYRNSKEESGLNNTNKIDVVATDNDEVLSSHHTIYKNDIIDNVSHERGIAVADTVPHKGKVNCKCPKCEENPGNIEGPGNVRLSDEIGDVEECPQYEEEPLENQQAPATKRVSQQIMQTELPQRISQESMSPRPTQIASIPDDKANKKPVLTKNDRHNSLQIPGPLPIEERNSGGSGSKASKVSSKSVSLQNPRGKRINRGISIDGGVPGSGQTGGLKENSGITAQNGRGIAVLNGKTANINGFDNKQAVSNMPINFGDAAVSEMQNQDAEKRLSFEPKVTKDDDFGTATCSRDVTNVIDEAPLAGTQTLAGQDQRIELCEQSATVCDCPEGLGVMPTLRSCSGTQTFTSLPQNFVFRRCACFAGACSGAKSTGLNRLGASKPVEEGRALTPSPGNTYTVPEPPEVFKSRASTPENTDNEISVMTDLPTERDGTTPRDVLSPGEHKATATYTDSYTPRHDFSLSEGEVPNGTNYPKRKVSMSMGEYPGDKRPDDINPYNQESSAQRMEAALQAISQELARCRSLLHSQRPREVTYGPSII